MIHHALKTKIQRHAKCYNIHGKKVRKCSNKQTNKPPQCWGYVQGIKKSTEKTLSGQLQNNLSIRISKVILDYNPEYRIYSFILI